MEYQDLHSSRIDLIRINKDGLFDMHEYSIKPEFYKYFEYKPFRNIEETEIYLEKLISRSNLETSHYWFIRLKKENKIIGTFGLINIDVRKGSTEIGYGLSPDYWGQGLFKEVLITVLEYLFVDLQFHRVWAKTQSNNIPSVRALEKVGFTKEGVMRDFYLSNKGKRYNATLLSILRNEF